MMPLTPMQQTIVDSPFKKVDWLFTVLVVEESTSQGGMLSSFALGPAVRATTYHWSTKDVAVANSRINWGRPSEFSFPRWAPYSQWDAEDGEAYSFRIMDFEGIEMARNKSEFGVVAANNITFSVLNKDSELNPQVFVGATVTIALRVSDGTNRAVLRRWRFIIKKTEPGYQKFRCICEDFMQSKLRGDYPNTKLVSDIFKNTDVHHEDNVCVPIPFGVAYVPLRSVYKSEGVTLTGTDIYVLESTNGSRCTINRTGATDFSRIETGRYVTVSGFPAFPQNNGTFLVVKATANQIELTEDAGLATESEGWTISITMGSRYYVLGTCDKEFTIYEVRTPRRWGRKSSWLPVPTGGSGCVDCTTSGPMTFDEFAKDRGFPFPVGRTWNRYEIYNINLTYLPYLAAATPAQDAGHWIYSSGIYNPSIPSLIPAKLHYFNRFPRQVFTESGAGLIFGKRHEWSFPVPYWSTFQPIIADSNKDGIDDSPGVWRQGEVYLDMPTKFSRSDTVAKTNPADILDMILSDMGINEIDRSSFAAAAAEFNSWGLTWNGALWFKEQRKKLLSRLLIMCNSNLVSGESIELYPLINLSQRNITGFDILKSQDVGEGTFTYSDIREDFVDDCGYIAWQTSGESQDAFVKTLVPAKSGVFTRASKTICDLQWVQDSRNAQRLGTFFFQRLLKREAEVSFKTKATCIALNPGDMITIHDESITGHRPYGGGTTLKWSSQGIIWGIVNSIYTFWQSLDYDVVIDRMKINKDLSIDFTATRHSCKLDDWFNIYPDTIVPSEDEGTEFWQPSVSGPLTEEHQSLDAGTPYKTYLTVSPVSYKGDYQNIQEAVNALPDSNANGILLKPGDYTLSSVVHLPNRDIEIVGTSRGGVTIYSESVLGEAFRITNRTKTYVFDSFSITSRSRGDNIPSYGCITVSNTIRSSISVTCKNLGFLLNGGMVGAGVTATASGDCAIMMLGADGYGSDEHLIVDKCYIGKGSAHPVLGGYYGVYTEDWSNIKITSNAFDSTSQYGIYVYRGDSFNISLNSIKRFNGYGIFSNDIVSGAEISDNKVDALQGYTFQPLIGPQGIRGLNAPSMIVKGNVVYLVDCYKPTYGIIVGTSDNATITSNTVRMTSISTATTALGIYATTCEGPVINGNNIYINVGLGGTHAGVYLATTARASINGNYINMVNNILNQDYGIYLDASSGGCHGTGNLGYNTDPDGYDGLGTSSVYINDAVF